jgi:enoyl-CoA hydratase/carnithine racemase
MQSPSPKVTVAISDAVWTVSINRPAARNAVDNETSEALAAIFKGFEADADARVGILTGAGGNFCAGADLKEIASGNRRKRWETSDDGPMGPTRLLLSKPVIAAVEGYAVAGGLELAIWCDLRVAGKGATFGVFSRRWGVPLIDGGTVRLPRLIGQSRALDMILTGRAVGAEEAEAMGLADRLAPQGGALAMAQEMAAAMAQFPPQSLSHDRLSTYTQWALPIEDAIDREFAHRGEPGEAEQGAGRFVGGAGRHGSFSDR